MSASTELELKTCSQIQAAWYSGPSLVEILKYTGKSFHNKNVFGLLIFITHFIILTDELRVQIRHVYSNNDRTMTSFFFSGFNRLIW